MRPRLLGWCAVLVVLVLGTPAWAHVETASVATPLMDGVWLIAGALALGLVMIARRRRGLAVACLTVLVLVAFESGVHSVHHLVDQLDPQCGVASTSAHTGGVAVESVRVALPADAATPVTAAPPVRAALRLVAPDLGRAPPTV